MLHHAMHLLFGRTALADNKICKLLKSLKGRHIHSLSHIRVHHDALISNLVKDLFCNIKAEMMGSRFNIVKC